MNVYRIEILIAGGEGNRRVISPPFSDREEAEEEVKALSAVLSSNQPVIRPWIGVKSGANMVAAYLIEEKVD